MKFGLSNLMSGGCKYLSLVPNHNDVQHFHATATDKSAIKSYANLIVSKIFCGSISLGFIKYVQKSIVCAPRGGTSILFLCLVVM